MKWLPPPSVPRCWRLLVFVGDRLEAPGQCTPGLIRGFWHVRPSALIVLAEGLAVGYGLLDGAAQAVQIVRQVAGQQ